MSDFSLHPQLAADCRPLASLPLSELLLHRNAAVPWFILVPRVNETELCDLAAPDRVQLQRETDAVARFVRERFDVSKLNVAAIGNLVPQLHVHVVGRHTEDPCWPNPVWGYLKDGAEWSEDQVASLRDAVRALAA